MSLLLWFEAVLATILPLIHGIQLSRALLLNSKRAWHIPSNLVSRSLLVENTMVNLCIALICLSGVLFLDYAIRLLILWFEHSSKDQKSEAFKRLPLSNRGRQIRGWQLDDDSDQEDEEDDEEEQDILQDSLSEDEDKDQADEAIPLQISKMDDQKSASSPTPEPMFDFQPGCWMLRLLHWRYSASIQLMILLVLVILELLVMVHPDSLMLVLGSLAIFVTLILGMTIAWQRFRYAHRLVMHAQNPVELEAAAAVSTWALPHPPIPRWVWNLHLRLQTEIKGNRPGQTKQKQKKQKKEESPEQLQKQKWDWFLRYQHMWTWPIYAIFVVSTLLMFIFFLHTFGQSRPFYSMEQRRSMEQDNTAFEDWRRNQLNGSASASDNDTTAPPTVVLIVLDGLRYDAVLEHPDWIALRRNTTAQPWAQDLLLLSSTAAMPTVSMPNWASLVSGARPEITGILGNVFISQITVDHLFVRASRFDPPVETGDLDLDDRALFSDFNFSADVHVSPPRPLNRAVVGSTMYEEMLQAALPPLVSQGGVPVVSRTARVDANTNSVSFFGIWNWLAGMAQSFFPILNYESNTTLPASSPINHRTLDPSLESDLERTQTVTEALMRDSPYRLLLLHLEAADHFAHQFGTTHKMYKKACALYARSVRRLLALAEHRASVNASDRVLVVVTADHGHVQAGGHGGLGRELRHVPLLLYYPHLTRATHNQSVAKTQAHLTVVDIPTTLALVQGIPVPRQSTGRWIDALLPLVSPELREPWFKDMYEQRRLLTWYFMIQSGLPRDTLDASRLRYPSLKSIEAYNQTLTDPLDSDVDLYASATFQLHDVHERARESVTISLLIRNFVVGATVAATVLLFVWWRFHVHAEFQFLDTPLRIDLDRNWLVTLGIVVLYMAVTIGLYTSVYAIRGYSRWDSTHLHSDAAMPAFLLTALMPGIGFMFFLQRIQSFSILSQKQVDQVFVKSDKHDDPLFVAYDLGYRVWQFLWIDFYLWRARTDQTLKQAMDHLTSCSLMLMMTTGVVMMVFILESILGVLTPLCVPIQVVDSLLWEYRFRVLSVHVIILPLMYGSIWRYQVALHAAALKISQRKTLILSASRFASQ